MAVEVRANDVNPDVKVVLLSGRLDMATADEASPVMLQALEDSQAGIVVNLAEVAFMSSSGLRMLIAACQRSQASGKQIALIGSQPAIYKIFKVASLDKMFKFFETEDEAIQALWS